MKTLISKSFLAGSIVGALGLVSVVHFGGFLQGGDKSNTPAHAEVAQVKHFGISVEDSVSQSKIVDIAAADIPAQIKVASTNGIELLKRFPADMGLEGWLVKNSTNYNVWFSDASGHVFVGALLNPTGENLTAKYIDAFAPPDTNVELLESTVSINTVADDAESKSNPIYVFYEPNCGWCSVFHAAAEPYIARGADVRWVPLSFLQVKEGMPSGYELLGRILKADDPLGELDKHEQLKAQSGGRAGLPEGLAPDASIFKVTEKNSQIFRQLGFQGTPAIAYIKDNGRVELIKGIPKMSELPGLFGMDRQDSSDGRLMRIGAQPSMYPVLSK